MRMLEQGAKLISQALGALGKLFVMRMSYVARTRFH